MSLLLIVTNLLFVYISIRLYKSFFSKRNFLIIVPLFFVMSYLFVLLRIVGRVFNIELPALLYNISYVLLAIFICLILVFGLFDVLRIITPMRKAYKRSPLMIDLALFVIALGFFGYGYYNQSQTEVVTYDLTFAKPLAKPLKIAAISDIHIGVGTDANRLQNQVDKINSLKPDIIVLVGDIIDMDIKEFTPEFQKILNKLNSPLGVYGVLGNHEYISGARGEVVNSLTDAGITVLINNIRYFEDYGFTLAGRDSLRRSKSNDNEREPISVIASKIEHKDKPIILLDHIPRSTEDAKKLNADLQLSGHTHGGQFFPATLVVKKIYPIAHGLLKEGALNFIVSSGMGLWGPPMRIGTHSEIVLINAK